MTCPTSPETVKVILFEQIGSIKWADLVLTGATPPALPALGAGAALPTLLVFRGWVGGGWGHAPHPPGAPGLVALGALLHWGR